MCFPIPHKPVNLRHHSLAGLPGRKTRELREEIKESLLAKELSASILSLRQSV